MKKLTTIGIILILLAVMVVPAMAKSPITGSDSGNSGKGNSPAVTEVANGQGNGNSQHNKEKEQNQHAQANQHSQQNQEQEMDQEHNTNGNHFSTPVRTPFYLQGTISAVDPISMTVTVTLTQGNARVKEYIGTELILQASDTTQIYKINQMDENEEEGPNRLAIAFDQLAEGDIVAIHGNLVDGIYNARLITVYVRAPLGEQSGEPTDSSG
jgi:Sec-independent protein translocase protein TatA